jgi:hypothetical protein
MIDRKLKMMICRNEIIPEETLLPLADGLPSSFIVVTLLVSSVWFS